MNKDKIKNIVIALTSSVITFGFSILLFTSNTNSNLSKVQEENKVNNKSFAIMLQGEDGYVTSDSNSWPTNDYKLNQDLTNCLDSSGAKIENVLNFDNGQVSMKANKNLFCYLYFDKINASEFLLKNSPSGLNSSTAYRGLYRFIGNDTSVNNYVKLSDNNTEVLYRIIGITTSTERNTELGIEANQLKLIKASSLGNYNWHTSTTDVKWESSAVYSYLQGSSVLGNENIIPTDWLNKISSVKWNIGDVKNTSPANGNSVVDLEIANITSSSSKVGLMYLSDYYYAYNNGDTNCASSSCLNWLINTTKGTWTMTRYTSYSIWGIDTDGSIDTNWGSTYAAVIRPVIYLTSNVYISNPNATGSETDPFILSY